MNSVKRETKNGDETEDWHPKGWAGSVLHEMWLPPGIISWLHTWLQSIATEHRHALSHRRMSDIMIEKCYCTHFVELHNLQVR